MGVTDIHRVLGGAVIASWLVVCFWALILKLRRRDEAPVFWRAVSVAQVLLAVQLAFGVALFAMGRRPGAGGAYTNVFHSLYGFGFPALVLFYSHKWAREGRRHPFAVFSFAALVIMALAMRSYMVGVLGA